MYLMLLNNELIHIFIEYLEKEWSNWLNKVIYSEGGLRARKLEIFQNKKREGYEIIWIQEVIRGKIFLTKFKFDSC